MEAKKDGIGMLDLITRPGFCVKENVIAQVNQAAQSLLILPDTDVRGLLLTGVEEYAAFAGGCLYVKLNLTNAGCGASVVRVDGMDVFVLDQESDDGELQALALAARELREPLTSILICTERLLPLTDPQVPAGKELAARLNRGLHQMLRIIGNMSDAGRCAVSARMETRNISEVFAEVLEKAQVLVEQAGLTLTWQGLSEELPGLLDTEQVERAVLNILSNAVKFTPKGGRIDVRLTRKGRMLSFSVQDSGSGIAENVKSSIFRRYLRQPGIEDGRYGLGLGMVLIRSAAANHGGTVLIDQPNGKGTRVTMTLTLRQSQDATLRSPILRVDYAGERDHGLIELADSLPASLYEKER